MTNHLRWMRIIVEGAKAAAVEGEEPTAAVIVQDDVLIGLGRNTKTSEKSGLSHAILNALLDAKLNLGLRPKGVTLYSTLEPCAMCFAALIFAGINTIVYGADDPDLGAAEMFKQHPVYGEKMPEIIKGVMQEECEALKGLPAFKRVLP